jgi:hypothetical protein
MDDQYDTLEKLSNPLWADGLNRNEILKNTPRIPGDKLVSAQMMALLLKATEFDAERAGISHDGTRQVIYASGLLPRNVAAPEWVQFGMGSFFETPLGAPWPSVGGPSMEHLPNFRDYRKLKRFEKSAGDTLRKVVTDAYFREALKDKDSAVERKARASAWALTYFLMQTRPEGMLRYYKELSKQPRDVELDEATLLGCFARAFDAVDSSKNVDAHKIDELANQWYKLIDGTNFGDLEDEIQAIRTFIAKVTKDPPKDATPGGGTQPPPGGGPGRPPGGSGRPPGGGPP